MPMHVLRLIVLALLSLTIWPATTIACIWDYDTLLQEKARFPSALEVIAGKFPRHSREFYEWRIQDRLRRLKSNPDNLAAYDDLAVAYEKTGDHAKAIALMIEKEHKKPGLYETAANLATFHMLAGNWEEGLKHVDRALAINPNAHFGREKYQKYVCRVYP
jgi:tetratricopeptide (TPR) repeat protein